MRKIILLAALLLVLAFGAFVALAAQEPGTQGAAAGPLAQTTPTVAATEAMTATQVVTSELEIPFLDRWLGSAHADAATEPFRHWDEESPPEIPVECAKCHSTPGYRDFLGADGTTAGEVDNPAPIGTVIECVACHNDVTVAKTSVVMPSGIEITGLGDESRCMECHQGRESKVSVDAAIQESGVATDTVSADLRFLNIHYYAAAATKYGTLAKGGYEYDGKTYDANFAHVEPFNTCNECHDQHTLELRLEQCSTCHTGVSTVEDLRDVRMNGSLVDYDGDGDIEEGISFELQGMQEMLLQAIQAYASEVAGTAIAYDAATYPYFVIDTNENGQADGDEAAGSNAYNAWTPRLLKAAYNYQTSVKDPGAYAHGGKYIIQLLYDSIEDLNTELSEPVDLSAAHRIDAGHFAGSEEAFRHWDEDGAVPADCSKCHSAGGLPTFLQDGATVSEPPANGLQCATCHDDVTTFTRYQVTEVEFPSGAMLTFGEGVDSNLCLECHQGRESQHSLHALLLGLDEATVSSLSASELLETVSAATEQLDDDTVADNLRFLNIHYFAAGATLFGTEAKGAYEYDGKEYLGQFAHVPNFNTCQGCHNVHSLKVQTEQCSTCHTNVESEEDLTAIRMSTTDYDGDGDTTEGIAGEVDTMREALYAAMQTYAGETTGTEPIVYNPSRHPYYFIDANENGQADAGDADQYNTWTPRLLRAAYNYQYSTKDPGAFAHNGKYIVQVLYDALEDMGADVSGMTRP